jgi:hypothetical protein
MPNMQITKRDLLKVVNGILDGTGCREICRQCVVKHPEDEPGAWNNDGVDIIVDGKKYGKTRGGCCTTCAFLTEKGCKPNRRRGRSLGCTLHLCERIELRLKQFGILGWVARIAWNSYGDIRNPGKIPLNYTLDIKFPRDRRSTQW